MRVRRINTVNTIDGAYVIRLLEPPRRGTSTSKFKSSEAHQSNFSPISRTKQIFLDKSTLQETCYPSVASVRPSVMLSHIGIVGSTMPHMSLVIFFITMRGSETGFSLFSSIFRVFFLIKENEKKNPDKNQEKTGKYGFPSPHGTAEWSSNQFLSPYCTYITMFRATLLNLGRYYWSFLAGRRSSEWSLLTSAVKMSSQTRPFSST